MDSAAALPHKGGMRVIKWLGAALAAVVLLWVGLDTFGGRPLDGPLGPIPGGAFVGPVSAETAPKWDGLPEVIELEIRPSEPWSLSVWNVVIDGQLYVPSAMGARRRWTAVALDDPRVRIRAGDQIYEQRIVRVTDPAQRQRIGQAVAERYELAPPDPNDDTTWFFRIEPR